MVAFRLAWRDLRTSVGGGSGRGWGQALIVLLCLALGVAVITHDRDLAGRLPRRVEMLDGRIVHDSEEAA